MSDKIQEVDVDEVIESSEEEMMEEDMIIPLVDTNGNEVNFRLIYVVEYEGDDYALLNPVEATEDIGEDEILIFKIVTSEDGEEDALLPPESEEIVDKVYEKFMQEYYAEGEGCNCGCEDCTADCKPE